MKVIDPAEVCDRGLRDPDALRGPERLVFILQEFDILMEMEGWVHFFLYERHFTWYDEMKDWLRHIGDEESLAVLLAYESWMRERGFDATPSAVERWLQKPGAVELREPDWVNEYTAMRERRWERARAHLAENGYLLRAE